ncbi:diaminopimelate epimerase [Aestuariibius sp. 2305UL40-4]|uniref:diaminopimelate epimerase n=1 Tax=Aestuariibius violaceus TaxID=3234132 RepID=UPI00345E59FC
MVADSETGLPFMKMHGAGNDFVVIDARLGGEGVSSDLCRAMADRHFGVGFDQLAIIEPSVNAELKLAFLNADGSASAACGNATRCIARHVMDATEQDTLAIRTGRGALAAQRREGTVWINMGQPMTAWRDIPIAKEADTLHLPLPGDPVATSMGNPHCTFFVDDAEAAPIGVTGPEIERDPLFPERTNVQMVSLTGPDRLRVRVWERGTGLTLASGSSSCAVTVAAHRRGLTDRAVQVDLDGGTLHVDWREDGVWMTGPTAHVFTGTWHGAVLEDGQWRLP